MKAHWRKCPTCLGQKTVLREVSPGAFDFFGPGVPCPTCKGRGKIRVRPKPTDAPKQSKFMRHMNIYAGKRRVSLATLMRKIP